MELKDKILKIIKDNQSYVGDDIYFSENALLEDSYDKVADEIAKLLIDIIDKMEDSDFNECYNGFTERVLNRLCND